MFLNVGNSIANSYWERYMPRSFRKSDLLFDPDDLTEFLMNKYVVKKWANNDEWDEDPAWLYENK